MRFIVFVKASKESETGAMPEEKGLLEMNAFNEQLVKAGAMLAGEGLHPSSEGVRIEYAGGKRKGVDGPFGETKELVAGFWILQVKSQAEAIEWLKREPFKGGSVEIRQVFDAEDFAYAPEAMAKEQELRSKIEHQAKSCRSLRRWTYGAPSTRSTGSNRRS